MKKMKILINELVKIMEGEHKDSQLKRMLTYGEITEEEYDEFEHELSPQTIKNALKKRKVVTFNMERKKNAKFGIKMGRRMQIL